MGYWKFNSDGIDIVNSSNVTVRNSFIRAFYDVISIKGIYEYPKAVENLTVDNCVLWCGWGHTCEIGVETRAAEFKNFTFKNCDCIHNQGPAMAMPNEGNSYVHHVRYENVNCEFQKDTLEMMYQLTETSKFMMSFVIVTKQENVIIVDGGRPEDMLLLKQCVAGRHISAWILTHAHTDHISGFIDEMMKSGGADFDIEKVYCNFPPLEIPSDVYIPDIEYFKRELYEMVPAFEEIRPMLGDKLHITNQGESIHVDECKIDFLFSYHRHLTSNLMNDSSLVFKVTTPNTSVLFLGDLGPDGGNVLFRESRHLLKSDIVQMAHHGHMNVSMEVYTQR